MRSAALTFILLSLAPQAAASVETAVGPGFVVIESASGVDGCLPRPAAQRAMRDWVLGASESAGIDPQLGVVLSLEIPPCADLFYSAVSNDIRGIGYQHRYEEELFDESPDSALEGVAFLNDTPYWEEHTDELRRAFLHEVGHRWSARIHVDAEDSTRLLGRDYEHWSYFLDTSSAEGVSPLEGNAWEPGESGQITFTDELAPAYSDLDLYLMGAVAPEEVGAMRLVKPASLDEGPTDCRGAALQPVSPPQHCGPLELMSSVDSLTIDDVIAAEGEREPSAQDAPRSLKVGFFFLSSSGTWDRESCEHWKAEVDDLVELFGAATRGRMELVNVTASDVECETLLDSLIVDPDSPNPDSSGCQVRRRPSDSNVPLRWLAGLLVGLATCHRRRFKRKTATSSRSS